MCGLVGFAGKKGNVKDIISFLLVLDSTRGTDGTGLYMTNFKEEELVKSPEDCYQLINNRRYSVVSNKFNLFIGHNRASTRGTNSTSNSHPFRFTKIVGAHNGTLRNTYNLENHSLFEVDSQLLYYMINKEGVRNAIPKIEGAWSLVWYNKEEQSLNFLRNKERPLTYAFDNDGNLYWASEEWMLEATFKKFDIKYNKIKSTEEDILYSFMFDKGLPVLVSQNKIEGKKPVSIFSNKKYYSHSSVSSEKLFECAYCGERVTKQEISFGYNVWNSKEHKSETVYVCNVCDELHGGRK